MDRFRGAVAAGRTLAVVVAIVLLSSACATDPPEEGLSVSEKALLFAAVHAVDDIPAGVPDGRYAVAECDPGPYDRAEAGIKAPGTAAPLKDTRTSKTPTYPMPEWNVHTSPKDSREAFRAAYDAARKCLFHPVTVIEELGCVDLEAEISMTMPSWYLAPAYSKTYNQTYLDGQDRARMVRDAHTAMFQECVVESFLDTFDVLGARTPDRVPMNALFETYIEVCGDGERTFVEWRSIGWGGAGAGGASGTDSLIFHWLVDEGYPWPDVIDAMVSGYESNNVRCLAADTRS